MDIVFTFHTSHTLTKCYEEMGDMAEANWFSKSGETMAVSLIESIQRSYDGNLTQTVSLSVKEEWLTTEEGILVFQQFYKFYRNLCNARNNKYLYVTDFYDYDKTSIGQTRFKSMLITFDTFLF